MSFIETNDNVAGVESENRRLLGPPPPDTMAGIELTAPALRTALDAHLLGAIRRAGATAPGQEATALESIRDRFDLVVSRAGVATLAARSGRDVAEEIGQALARPSGPGAEAYAHWHAQMMKQKQWQQERPDYVARGLSLPRPVYD